MKKKDIILIVAIALIAVISFIIVSKPPFVVNIYNNIFHNGEETAGGDSPAGVEGNTVIVRVDRTQVGIYSLDENAEYILNGGTHILVIENGCAYLKDVKCRDHICEKQGKVSYNNQTLTCLPYKLTVTVSSEQMPSVDFES